MTSSILTPLALTNAPILQALRTSPNSSASAIAEAIGRDGSNVRKSLKALETAGLVVGLTLSPEGSAVIEALERAENTELPAQRSTADSQPIHHDQIFPDPQNPRRDFDSEGAVAALDELSASIARDSLLENLVLRPLLNQPGPRPLYMIIAGERRWRAIGLAIQRGALPVDWPVPHTIREVDEVTARRLALVENLQRRDLKPLEEARALQQLVELDGRTTSEIAGDIGFTQRWAQQRLQLLQLSPALQTRLDEGSLKIEGARIVLSIWDKLPPIKQAELEAGKTRPEEAKAWLDMQPTPLSDAAKLALCEFMKKWEAEPFKVQHYSDPCVEITAETVRKEIPDSHTSVRVVVSDPALDELVKRSIFNTPAYETIEGVETGRHYLQRRYYSDHYVKEAFATALDPKARDQAIAVLRVQLHGLQTDYDLTASGRWATAWLNVEPREIPADVQAVIDEKLKARAESNARHAARREEEDAQRAAKQTAHAARLNRIKAAEAELTIGEDPIGAAGALAAETGLPLPWFFDESDGMVIAANGAVVEDNILYGYEDKAPRRLMVALANAAAGVVSPAERPVEMDPDAMAREDFLARVVAELTEASAEEGAPAPLPSHLAYEVAPKALDRMLAEEGWIYGEADAYDWNIDGAASLAGAIQRGEYASEDDAQLDIEDAIAAGQAGEG